MKEDRKPETYCYIFLLPEEAHADVVPQRGALGDSAGYQPVLGEGNVEVPVGLHHAASRQGRLRRQASGVTPDTARRQQGKMKQLRPRHKQLFNFFRCFLLGAAKTSSGEQMGTLQSPNM